MILHPLSCFVEEGVLRIVGHAVGDEEVEVLLKLLQAPVVMSVDAFPHRGKVHGFFYVVHVVRNLQGTERSCQGWRQTAITDIVVLYSCIQLL